MTLKSRFAPTPSGFLHTGNGFNFLLTYLLTKSKKGQIHLRIDDYDPNRTRLPFVVDIFETLKWLGLSWDSGPNSPADFLEHHSSKHRRKLYLDFLAGLENTFVCTCSRKDLSTQKGRQECLETCYKLNNNFEPGVNCIKYKYETEPFDFVIWTREDFPAYQLGSLVDDFDLGINFIVRGEDLEESTQYQLVLAKELKLESFLNAKFIHHKLVQDETGHKLSKSDKSTSLKYSREHGMSQIEFYQKFCLFMDLQIEGTPSLEKMEEAIKSTPLYTHLA